MTIRPIRNASDHERALKRIEALMSAKEGTAEGEELDVLAMIRALHENLDIPPDASGR